MGARPKKCRACKKRPIWLTREVKDVGPFCKRCYHRLSRPPSPERKGTKSPANEFADLEYSEFDFACGEYDQLEIHRIIRELEFEEEQRRIESGASDDDVCPFLND